MADLSSDRRGFLARGAIAAGAAMIAGGQRAAAAPPSALMGTAEPLRAIPMPAQVKAIEGVLHLPDADIGYWDTGGTGEAIILLHPMTGSARVWGYQQPVFAKEGYRVIGYSRRGYIGSSAGDKDKPGTAA